MKSVCVASTCNYDINFPHCCINIVSITNGSSNLTFVTFVVPQTLSFCVREARHWAWATTTVEEKNTSRLLLCCYHIVGIYNQSSKLLHPKIVGMSMLDILILWLVLLNSRTCSRFGATMLHVSLICCFSIVWFLHPLETPGKETTILLDKL